MLKCIHNECQETEPEKLFTVKLRAYRQGYEDPAIMYLRLPFCDAHKPPEGALEHLMRTNWEAICVGFERNNLARPELQSMEYTVVPWEEFVEFCKMQQIEGAPLTQLWKN